MSDNIKIEQLQPTQIWKNFINLNAVPRASKKETAVTAFVKEFGEKLGLETIVDHTGNVLIKKPATPGMENRQTVVLQSHIDMVHQKNSDTIFDFATQGIEMYIDGDFVKAKGTTLGADNGIGVATIFSILESTDIAHPAIEALFTVDEETGMTGAKALAPGFLSGSILLNLDTEDDDELTIGCAGGIDATINGNYALEQVKGTVYKISISGLTGGHSGVDIHLGRANANKLMNRLLFNLFAAVKPGIVSIEGGSLRNAIPRESVALIALKNGTAEQAKEIIATQAEIFKAEFGVTDSGLNVAIEEVLTTKEDKPIYQASSISALGFLRAMYACPNGIYRMTPGIEGLVQTSNNIAKVEFKDGAFAVQCLTRSSVDSEKLDMAAAIGSAFELIGGKATLTSDYPGWEPRPGAEIVKLMGAKYVELFGEKPHINAIHAGLECGIIGAHYPAMDMISFGPNIFGAHSPDERVEIKSVQKFWKYLLEVLKEIPEKKNI